MADHELQRDTTRIGKYEFTVAPADPSGEP